MDNVIDVYVENAKGYIENYENNARGISRSIFERQLIEALLKSKLKLEPNLSLIYAIMTGERFDRWWRTLKDRWSLDEAQTERYMVDQALCTIPLSLALASDSDSDSDSDDNDGANSSALYHGKDTDADGQDVDVDPPSPDASTKGVKSQEEVSRPKSRRPPLKNYGPEIAKIEKVQAKQDGAYHPNKGLQDAKAKGKRGSRSAGGPSTSKGKSLDIVLRSIARFDNEQQLMAVAEAEAEAEAEDGDEDGDGEDEVITDA